MPATRRRSARQVAVRLAQIDDQITRHDATLARLARMWEGKTVPGPVYDVWNGVHDARADLLRERAEVEANEKPVEWSATRDLISRNID